MARVFQTDENKNLPRNFFEFKNVPEMPARTIESVISSDKGIWSEDAQVFGDIPMFSNNGEYRYNKTVLEGIQEATPFSNLFFSRENIKEIQSLIRYNVYTKSGGKHIISEQNETELVIVMRGVFLQYSLFPQKTSEYTPEISRLNRLVLNTVLPNLISNIEQYYGYLKDLNSERTIMKLPQVTSSSGTRTEGGGTADALFGDSFFDY